MINVLERQRAESMLSIRLCIRCRHPHSLDTKTALPRLLEVLVVCVNGGGYQIDAGGRGNINRKNKIYFNLLLPQPQHITKHNSNRK